MSQGHRFPKSTMTSAMLPCIIRMYDVRGGGGGQRTGEETRGDLTSISLAFHLVLLA